MKIALSTAVAVLATACGVIAAGSDYVGDRSGCGKSHDELGLTRSRSIESSGAKRNYSVYLPSDYERDKEYPLILGFHGSESIGLFFEADTGFSNDASYSKIMVYPDGLGGAWAGANYSKASVDEDLQFVWDMLTDLRKNFCVDSARVYATGMSIGGGFVDTIACNATVGGEFAAFAPVAGAFYTDNDKNYKDCKPARLAPILEMHGADDDEVPFDGGKGSGGELPAILDWTKRWAGRHDCSDISNFESTVKDVLALDDDDSYDLNITGYDCPKNMIAIVQLKISKHKHSWPASDNSFSGIVANDAPTPFNATDVIEAFFKMMKRPAGEKDRETPSSSPSPEPTQDSGDHLRSFSSLSLGVWVLLFSLML